MWSLLRDGLRAPWDYLHELFTFLCRFSFGFYRWKIIIFRALYCSILQEVWLHLPKHPKAPGLVLYPTRKRNISGPSKWAVLSEVPRWFLYLVSNGTPLDWSTKSTNPLCVCRMKIKGKKKYVGDWILYMHQSGVPTTGTNRSTDWDTSIKDEILTWTKINIQRTPAFVKSKALKLGFYQQELSVWS